MKFDNYYLDLEPLSKLSEKEQETIHTYYREMLFSFHDGRKEMATSYFNTLLKAGYLKCVRDEKINDILNDK